VPATPTRSKRATRRPALLRSGSLPPEPIPRRLLGRTGERVSALGLGGYHLGNVGTECEAIRIVHEAIGAGLTFMDNAWEYHEGKSEERMGKALAGRRSEVFLMTKVCTHGRDAKVAMKQLDTVQMPLNCFDATFRSFEQRVLPELQARDIAALGMKSLGGDGEMVQKKAVTAPEALRYAMSLPVATTISGIDSIRVLHQNLRIARGFVPMTADEMQALRDRCAPDAADGRHESYKVTGKHEGPVGRKQHGFPESDD
jgi:aryl-alcohol dehydrogenase-like predicted oxidoreductase